MPSTSLQPGRYWVGNPRTVFPDWVPSPTYTYHERGRLYHAFLYGDNYVAAIPDVLITQDILSKPGFPKMFMTFKTPTLFYENNGFGKIDGVELGPIHAVEQVEEVTAVEHIYDIQDVQVVEEIPFITKDEPAKKPRKPRAKKGTD